MRIAIIHGNDGSDVRVGKLCRTLSKNGHDVHFIGWDRRPDERKAIDLGLAAVHLMMRPTRFGRATLTGSLMFWAHIIRCLHKIKPTVVSCVNEDTALMVLPCKSILFDHLICEVFDALVDRHSNRSWFYRQSARAISRLSRGFSDRIIVTDHERYQRIDRFKDKCVVIENYPEDPGSELALTDVVGDFKIFVAGSLSKSRGLEKIIASISDVDDFRIVCAGWAYDDYAKNQFLEHPKVEYLGILTAKETLRQAAGCDAIFAFYQPSSVNNIFASPNKIYDAMAVGRPVIINSEVRVSKWVTESELGWACTYDNQSDLRTILSKIRERRADLAAFAARCRQEFEGAYSWDSLEIRLVRAYVSF